MQSPPTPSVFFHGRHGLGTTVTEQLTAHARAAGLAVTNTLANSSLKYIVHAGDSDCDAAHPSALVISHAEFLALSATRNHSNPNKRSFALVHLDLDVSSPLPSSSAHAPATPDASHPRPTKRSRTAQGTPPNVATAAFSLTKKTTVTTTTTTTITTTMDGSTSDTDDDGDDDEDEPSGPIDPSQHTVAFTGTFISGSRKEVTVQAEKLGFKTKPSITSAVTLVVHGENEGETAKLRAARERGLMVMSEDDWLAKVVSPSKLSKTAPVPPPPTKPTANKSTPNVSSSPRVVVFTGTLPSRRTRAQVTAQAVAAGYMVKPSLTKDTTVLVFGAGSAADAKVAEARGLGIETLSEADWTQRLPPSSSSSSAVPEPAFPATTTPSASILANVSTVREADLARASSADTDAVTGALTFGGIVPKVILADGEIMQVGSASSSSKAYTIKRTGDSYYCTCPAWRMQKGAAADCRTCKHLKGLLGDEYEAARLGQDASTVAGAAATATTGRPKRTVPVKASSNTDTRFNMEVLLAQKWTDKVDPTGWHASEKLDGMRAYWCATRKKLFTRNHNVVNAPDWFIENFPTDMSLDGELYVGRDMFNATMSIVRGSAADDNWRNVRYQIFDIPSLNKPFEDRLQAMQDLVQELGIDHMQAVPHVVCMGTTHLLELLATVESKSGEGIMLRKPKSYYANGRSDTLLKVKTFADGEAVVIGHQLSTSSTYFGQLGALECRMASGKVFRVGSGLTADLRDLTKAPQVGTLITYKCQELTKDGVPRFPVFLGVAPPDRTDPSDPVFGGGS